MGVKKVAGGSVRGGVKGRSNKKKEEERLRKKGPKHILL